MIYVYGTSHVSEDSLELIDEKLEAHDPDIVALELDLLRLNAILNGEKRSQGPIFMKLIKKFQYHIGSKTGVMPGEEMEHAYRKSMEEGREVALIDQDIRITVERLKSVPRKEKVRAVLEAVAGMFLSGKFDASSIPEEDFIQELLGEFRDRYPQLFQVFVDERNQVMREALEDLQEENPESEIVAFVGAAHRKELEEMLNQKEG